MTYRSLLEEASRIRDIALSKFPPGKHIAAIFKNGTAQRLEIIIYYFNPRDIPLEIKDKFWNRFFLFSVQTYEDIKDLAGRQEALLRRKQTLDVERKSVHGVIERSKE